MDDSRPRGLTPEEARDLMVECFMVAQGEVFRRAALTLDMMADTATTRNQVENSVRLKFQELGHDYEHPTATPRREVMTALATQARIWGTPADVIEHHLREMNRVLDNL
ncbi:MAG: hypothetical protein ACYC6C_06385 [Coriobacteriia bacterium]